MERKLVYRDSDGVRRTMVTNDEAPGQIRVFTEVQMDEVLESIKRAREDDASRGFAPMNRHLARVPMTVYEQSLLEQWDDARWKRWLNDPENEAFRVNRGHV
jgi:hypothetical protein